MIAFTGYSLATQRLGLFSEMSSRRKANIDPGNATMFRLKSGETLKNCIFYSLEVPSQLATRASAHTELRALLYWIN
ncbi:hypothetical protein [Nostoc sp. LEGE 12450]|uniref:hypothetical protein n=1 Tax=Nostoc sp. LEGE 12450 TaxID=1828643 RepID=UPI00187E1770|nr:hypothetical protein [Nostoc sp. LEGE 12450]MBE8990444.1 hypothetical protein [Nostoc sp. LEGE 12450]